MPETLQPGLYFVAHAYKDQREIDKLKRPFRMKLGYLYLSLLKLDPMSLLVILYSIKFVHVMA
jgi:hypothetical protein